MNINVHWKGALVSESIFQVLQNCRMTKQLILAMSDTYESAFIRRYDLQSMREFAGQSFRPAAPVAEAGANVVKQDVMNCRTELTILCSNKSTFLSNSLSFLSAWLTLGFTSLRGQLTSLSFVASRANLDDSLVIFESKPRWSSSSNPVQSSREPL
jgi:hypothetical protein